MNINESKKILSELTNKINPNAPLAEEITRLFIPNWNQRSLILKDSLHGRVTQALTRRQSTIHQRKQAIAIVLKAFSTIRNEKKENDIPQHVFHQLVKLEQTHKKSDPLPVSEDLSLLESEQEKLIGKEKKEGFQQFSQLLQGYPQQGNLDPASFEKVFIQDSSDQMEALALHVDFLKENRNEAIEDFENEAIYLKRSFQDSQQFEQSLVSDLQKMETKEKRGEQYAIEGQRMANHLAGLRANERWLYCGEFSNTHRSLGSLLFFIQEAKKLDQGKRLPDDLDAILAGLKNKQHVGVEVEEIIRRLIEKAIDHTLGNNGLNPSKISFQMIFKEITSIFEKVFGRIYPKAFISEMKEAIQTVALEEFSSLVNNTQLILDGVDIVRLDPKDPTRKQKEKEIKEKVFKLITPYIEKCIHRIEDYFLNTCDQFHHLIPSSLETLFDLRLSRSHFWFECLRENDSFTVCIFATGYLNSDPTVQDKHPWPIIIKGIEPSKLSKEFFQRLLFILIEPGYSNQKVDKKMIEEGLISYLGGQKEALGTITKSALDMIQSPLSLAQSLLLKNPDNLDALVFKQQVDVFMLKLKSFPKTEDKIVINHAEGEVLLHAIDQLIEKRKAIKGVTDSLEVEQLTLIRAVVQDSIPLTVNRGQAILDTLFELISIKQLMASKTALIWAFGEEAGECIDLLAETVGKDRPANPTLVTPKSNIDTAKPRKKLLERQEFYKLKIAYYLISGTISLIQLAFLLSKISRIETFLLYKLLVKTFHYFQLSKYIPESCVNHYNSVMEKYHDVTMDIKLRVMGWLVNTFVHLFLKKENQEIYFEKIDSLKQRGTLILKQLLGKQTIQMDIQNKSKNIPKLQLSPAKIAIHQSQEGVRKNQSHMLNFTFEKGVLNDSKLILEHIKELIELPYGPTENLKLKEYSDYFELLTNRLLMLPIPKNGESDVWDDFSWQETSQIIEQLLKISFNYHFIYNKLINDDNFFGDEKADFSIPTVKNSHLSQNLITIFHSNLAIIDKLARKCEESQLGSQPIYFQPLFFHRKFPVYDPLLLNRIHEIQDYFDPYEEAIPKNLTELQSLASSSLFYPIFEKDHSLFVKCPKSKINSPEMSFLKNYIPLLKRDNASLKRLSLRIENGQLYFNSMKELESDLFPVSESDLVVVLFRESFKLNESFLPLGYRSLNILCRMCQLVTSLDKSTWTCFELNNFNENFDPHLTLKLMFDESKEDVLKDPRLPIERQMTSVLINKPDPTSFRDTRPSGKLKKMFNHLTSDSRFYFRDQDEVQTYPYNFLFTRGSNVESKVRYTHDKYHSQQNQQYELIQTREADIPIRILGYLNNFFLKHEVFACVKENREDKEHDLNLSDYINNFLYCWGLLFIGDHFKNQLIKTPEIADRFGKILSILISHTIQNPDKVIFYYLADFSLKVENYCREYAPKHCSSFPNIKQLIRQNSFYDNIDVKKGCYILLKAISIGSPESIPSSERLMWAQEVAVAYFSIHEGFGYRDDITNYWEFRSGDIALERQWAHRLRKLYWEWLPIIRETALNPSLQKEFFSKLLKTSSDDESMQEWRFEGEDRFTNGKCKINFNLGEIYDAPESLKVDALDHSLHSKQPLKYDFVIDKNKEREWARLFILKRINEKRSVQHCINNVIEDESKEFRFNVADHKNVKVTRVYQGKAFSFITNIWQENYWLEETESNKKTILFFNNNSLVCSFTTEGDIGKGIPIKSVIKDGVEYIPVNDPVITASFSHFCPANEMACWRLPGAQSLHKIDFFPYRLSLQVSLFDNLPRAFLPDLLPGYYVASNQFDPHLKPFSSYLLFENAQGQKKVIIPHHELKLSAMSSLTSQLGPLKNILSPFLVEYLFSKEETLDLPFYHFFSSTSDEEDRMPKQFSVVALEKDGELTSESPEILARLIVLHILHLDIDRVEQTIRRLQSILKREYVPVDTLGLLTQILASLPPQFSRVSCIRKKLFVAIEENQALYAKSTVSESFTTHLLRIPALCIDLSMNELDPRYELTLDEEWLLFQALSRSILNAVVSLPDFPKLFSFIEDNQVWEIFFSEIVLNQALRLRYESIKQKLEHETSLSQQAVHLIWTTATQKTETSYVSSELYDTLLEPIRNLKPSLNVKTEWINLFKLLLENYLTCKTQKTTQFLVPLNYPEKPLTLKQWDSDKSFAEDFLTAYEIARNGTKEKRNELELMLKLYRGGWGDQSKQLIEYLFSVLAVSFMFPKDLPEKSSCHLLEFMWKLDEAHKKVSIGGIVGRITIKMGAKLAISASSKLVVPAIASTFQYIPFINTMLNQDNPLISKLSDGVALLNTGQSITSFVRNKIKKQHALIEAPEKNVLKSRSPSTQNDILAYLKEEDSSIDAFLSKIYNRTFKEIVYKEKRVEEYPEKESSFNPSLGEYYGRSEEKFAVELIGEDHLRTLYQEIVGYEAVLSTNLENELKTLLGILNRGAKSLVRPIEYRDLIMFLLEGSFERLTPHITIKPEHHHLIERTLTRYIIRKTRLQQLQRIIAEFDMLGRYNPASEEYARQMEQIISELKSRRSYTEMQFSPRILLMVLLVELLSNKMLWPRQSNRIKTRFMTENQVLEFIMGMGKTEILSLLENLVDADGSKIIINIWPSSLINTNIRFLAKQSQLLFDQPVNHLEIQRLNSRRYIVIQHLLKRIQTKGETISQTKVEMQSLELMMIDYLNQAVNKKNNRAFQLAQDLGKILLLIAQKGKIIGDEVHKIFDETEELLRASGIPTPLDIDDFTAITECFKKLSADDEVLDIIRKNQLNDLTPKKREGVILNLAEKLGLTFTPCVKDPAKLQQFVSYVTNQSAAVPSWIQSSPFFRKITMMKGILTTHLPLLFDRIVDVDFGPSLKSDGNEVAVPYEANTCPKENSSIRNPHEAACKTIMLFLYHGLSENQMNKLIDKFIQNAIIESSKTHLLMDNTPSGEKFLQFTSTIPLSCSAVKRKELYPILKNNLAALFWYLENQVHPQILFWETNFRSNCHNFDAMFHSRDYKSGTPDNKGNYPDDVTMAHEPGTIGEGLHILENKCSENPIHLLKSLEPKAILQETLKEFFSDKNSRFTSLIDGGAKLTGMNSYTVAKEMRDFVKEHRKDITTIDFFYRDQSGDRLMSLPLEGDPIPYDQCHVPLKERLAYFDQFHGFGANLKLKSNGKGIALVGCKHRLAQLLQEAFRMRGIKEFRFFLSKITDDFQADLDALNKDSTQSVEFALTQPVAEAISKNPADIKLRDLLVFAENNQNQALKMSHFISYRQKVFNIVRRSILDHLLDALVNGSKQKALALFEAAQFLLISKVETNPIRLYKRQEKLIPIREVINGVKAAGLKQAMNTGVLSQDELDKIQADIEEIRLYPMPDFIKFPVDEDGINFEHAHETDLSVEVDQEVENDVEEDHEHETEVEQEQENYIQTEEIPASLNPGEQNWPDINPYSLDWLHFTNPSERSSFNWLSNFVTLSSPVPPLFRVQDLLLKSKFWELQDAFSNKIWFTNNFLPTHTCLKTETDLIGSKKQCELYEVIVHMNKKTGELLSVGCLSQYEMHWWREQLEGYDQSAEIAAFLYDIPTRAIVAGDLIPHKTLHSNPEFLELEAQLKFLNGDVRYEVEQVQPLTAWAKKNSPGDLLNAFISIHYERGKDEFDGSIPEHVLRTLIESAYKMNAEA